MTQGAAAIAETTDCNAEDRAFERDLEISAVDYIRALAALMRGSVDRLERTAGSVTGALMARAGKVDRDLVVALQDFDRLQQEFVALSDALTRSASALQRTPASEQSAKAGRDAIAAIAISDLRERLLSHLQFSPEAEASRPAAEYSETEEVF